MTAGLVLRLGKLQPAISWCWNLRFVTLVSGLESHLKIPSFKVTTGASLTYSNMLSLNPSLLSSSAVSVKTWACMSCLQTHLCTNLNGSKAEVR
jgi:hypothetical protein